MVTKRKGKGVSPLDLVKAVKANLRGIWTDPPRELTYLERKARLARIKEEWLVTSDGWAIYCSGDPRAWTAHWFNLSVAKVRAIQEPNAR